jgi:hypothetical protein
MATLSKGANKRRMNEFENTINQTIQLLSYEVLVQLGELGKEKMKEFANPRGNADSRLVGSITYAVKAPMGIAKGYGDIHNPDMEGIKNTEGMDDIIQPEKRLHRLRIGSGVPYAVHVNYGSGRHNTSDNHVEFLKNLADWCSRRANIYVSIDSSGKISGNKNDVRQFNGIYEGIVHNGVDYGKGKSEGLHFVEKTKAILQKRLSSILKRAKYKVLAESGKLSGFTGEVRRATTTRSK